MLAHGNHVYVYSGIQPRWTTLLICCVPIKKEHAQIEKQLLYIYFINNWSKTILGLIQDVQAISVLVISTQVISRQKQNDFATIYVIS